MALPKSHKEQNGGKWMRGVVKHPGALHRELRVPENKKISEKRLEKAAHSKSPLMRKRVALAETFKKAHH
jgi:hypothetical protein